MSAFMNASYETPGERRPLEAVGAAFARAFVNAGRDAPAAPRPLEAVGAGAVALLDHAGLDEHSIVFHRHQERDVPDLGGESEPGLRQIVLHEQQSEAETEVQKKEEEGQGAREGCLMLMPDGVCWVFVQRRSFSLHTRTTFTLHS